MFIGIFSSSKVRNGPLVDVTVVWGIGLGAPLKPYHLVLAGWELSCPRRAARHFRNTYQTWAKVKTDRSLDLRLQAHFHVVVKE